MAADAEKKADTQRQEMQEDVTDYLFFLIYTASIWFS